MSEFATTPTMADGVLIFPDQSFAESNEVESELSLLIEDAKKLGCIEALVKHDHNVKYLTNPDRLKYLNFIGIKATDDVLEIGSSMGQHTRLIAAKCRSLAALEVVQLQAKFARIWCDEHKLENVEISAGGANGKMPYADTSFDIVVLNYVLEWCSGRSEQHPEDFHQEYVREIYRILKPGGRVFISTKNRFSLKYLTGTHDEHLGMRFGSALPRLVQNRVRNRAQLGHPPGYLHSWHGLEQILKQAGFGTTRAVFCFPDARYPAFVGRFDDFSSKNLPEEVLSLLGRKDRFLIRLPKKLMKAFSNSLAFLATK